MQASFVLTLQMFARGAGEFAGDVWWIFICLGLTVASWLWASRLEAERPTQMLLAAAHLQSHTSTSKLTTHGCAGTLHIQSLPAARAHFSSRCSKFSRRHILLVQSQLAAVKVRVEALQGGQHYLIEHDKRGP